MKILHISHITFKGGGINTVLPQEIKFENNLKGINSELLVTSKINQIPNHIDFNCYIYKKHEINKLLNDISPDFIIFHSFYILLYIKIYWVLQKLKIPYLIKPHGGFSIIAQKKGFLKKKIANLFFYNKFVKNSNGIIYLTKGEKENSIHKNKEYYLMPNGVNMKNITKKNIKNSKNNLNILYLGRIDINHKGLDYLLNSIKKIKKVLIEKKVKFNIYGFGNEKDIKFLKDEISKVNEIVSFHGPVYGEEKVEAFSKSDIFILTSRYEGMPMGIIEALNYGLPCLITKETNMKEFITGNKRCGWISNLQVDSISNTLLEAVKDFRNNKDELRKNSLKTSQTFLWENNITQYKNEYSRIYNNITGGILCQK